MNMEEQAKLIYQSNMSKAEKIRQLKELILDCQNEMDAQDQNMQPEVQHRLSEGMRLAKDYVRELEANKK